MALDAAATIHPDQVQTVLNSTGTATNKLRALASLANFQWRHSIGPKKHMRNSDIRAALATLLALLSLPSSLNSPNPLLLP